VPRRLFVVLAAALAAAAAAPLAAQSRSQQLVRVARDQMSTRDLNAADATLTQALESALYEIDSVTVFVWRGVLEYMRGNDSLARTTFRYVVTKHGTTDVRGLDDVAPGLGDMFESEARPFRVFTDTQVDQRAGWRAGPSFVYPAELRRRRVAGHATVRMTIDSLGRVEERGLLILESPDPAFDAPLTQMVLATQFTPARRKGHAVRSQITLGFDLSSPPPESPTRLITAAREQLRVRRADSALTLIEQALDSVNRPSQGERAYALLVQGIALQKRGRDSLAALSFNAGLED
jgi:TonB family protein